MSKSEKRGEWSCSNIKQIEISPPNRTLIAFSTYLGIALWSECHSVFSQTDEDINLCSTSSPYPLKNPRTYGNACEMESADWLIHQIEPIVKHLVLAGSIVIKVGNDIFLNKSCARSLYRERLVIALSENWSYTKWMSLFGITHTTLLVHFYMRVLIELKSMPPGTLFIDLPMPHQEYYRITIECYNRTPANILNSFKIVVSIFQ